MDDLLQEFVAETREMMESLSGQIVAWEADPADRARLDAIFRFVHTVKGSCGFLDLPRLSRLAHAAEEALAAVRDGRRVADTPLVDAVLGIVDRIVELVDAIDAGVSLPDAGEELLVAALDGGAAAAPARRADAVAAPRAPSRSVRLSVELLDRMMNGMSDMVLARNELARRLRGSDDPALEAALDRMSATVADMREAVTRTRMQRIETLFSAVPRMVRDTAATLGKDVALVIEGEDVELDREMVELIRDPLAHAIRNAIDHGIETPADRVAAGKRATGTLKLSARQAGNCILIEIADDGRGIDVARLLAKAQAAGLYDATTLAGFTAAQQLDLVFAPGLSSRDTVTELSGRGVGMDVVRANVEQTGGQVTLDNRPGVGLTLVIQVPLTLSIIPAIVVAAAGGRYALPRQAVEEIVSCRSEQVRFDTIGDRAVVAIRDRRLAAVSLPAILGDAVDPPGCLAIVSTRDGDYALAIDAVLDVEELVVRPGAPAVMAARIYAGQTLPDTGEPMLLLDVSGIARVAELDFRAAAGATAAAAAEVEDAGVEALLFADLDGERRAIALAAVERVETVSRASLAVRGGRLHLAADGALIPVHARGALPTEDEVAVLRLSDGTGEIAYAIADAVEIAMLGVSNGSVAMIGDEQVELVDPFALFAGGGMAVSARPVCHLGGGETEWMRTFLRPMLEASGYRCVETLAPGERADVTVAMDDHPGGPPDAVRLRRARDGDAGSIWRYDRDALIGAMARAVRGEAA